MSEPPDNIKDDDNPFLALFEPPRRSGVALEAAGTGPVEAVAESLLRSVFGVTLSSLEGVADGGGEALVFLESLAAEVRDVSSDPNSLDDSLLDRAICERLLLSGEELELRRRGKRRPRSSNLVDVELCGENRPVPYLFGCFRRLSKLRAAGGGPEALLTTAAVAEKIAENLANVFREPEVFSWADPDVGSHLLQVFRRDVDKNDPDGRDGGKDFFDLLEMAATNLRSSASGQAAGADLGERIVGSLLDEGIRPLMEQDRRTIFTASADLLMPFAKRPELSRLLMLHESRTTTTERTSPARFDRSLLSTVLSVSCLPGGTSGGVGGTGWSFDFFDRPSGSPLSVHQRTEGQIWQGLEALQDSLFAVFNALVHASEETRRLTLEWIGNCLSRNEGRGKMWNMMEAEGFVNPATSSSQQGLVSDGFMLNLTGVLLRFCLPFTGPDKRAGRVFRIDPRYTSASGAPLSLLRDVHKETKLADFQVEDHVDDGDVVDDHDQQQELSSFNFTTHVFFMTHKALDLGMRVCHEKLVKVNQELARHQELHRELVQQPEQQMLLGSPSLEAVQSRTDFLMAFFLSLKAAMMQPKVMADSMRLLATTGTWLASLSKPAKPAAAISDDAVDPEVDNRVASRDLGFLPEHLLENVCECLLLVRRFNPNLFEEFSQQLPDLMGFVLTFMGSPKLLKNPHLRARLAECLECLLPFHEVPGIPSAGQFNREALFASHPERLKIVPCILNVFVSIEATGEAVQFELKFAYRRPMYEVLKYLWKFQEYRAKMVELAVKAERAMMSDEVPPLFLRFANLLMNDAIFLLDEALGHMKQIQEVQASRSAGSWSALPAGERSGREAQYRLTARLARHHNILGLDTIEMLEMLTGATAAVFTHPTMVDRVAAMLNYFLKHLVGPERRAFKVRGDVEEFAFKPAEIVRRICRIYTHYSRCRPFLLAVSADGRSYSPELFDQAKAVLCHIRDVDSSGEWDDLASRVRMAAADVEREDELFADAPDEYLDPIMSNLMRDPVLLPNSRQVVDRPTIARHILSDQTDPFTRAPLTMDMLVPQDRLREEILAWIESKKKSAGADPGCNDG